MPIMPARIRDAPRMIQMTSRIAGISRNRRGMTLRLTVMVASTDLSILPARFAARRSTRTKTAK